VSERESLVRLSYDSAGVATIRMSDQRGRNGLTPPFIDAFVHCLNEAGARQDVRAVVLAGLPDVFCSGADLNTLRRMCGGQLKPVDIVLSRMILHLPVPVVAAMEGHAVGGGLAIGLCADIAVLARESRYGCAFMNMGFTPGMGMTKLLEYYVSPSLAHEMLYTGRYVRGQDFVGKSAFNHIVPKNEVSRKAAVLARGIAEKPREALTVLKNYLSLGRRKTFEETLTVESMMHDITLHRECAAAYIDENYVKY
jgi:polyketide biosynthesis enoyl-CoA hydratase PksI